MADYIGREAAIDALTERNLVVHMDSVNDGLVASCHRSAQRIIANIPAADVVSRGAYDQTDWERCVALTQLKEIDKSLGERMDDVRPVVRGKWVVSRTDYGWNCVEFPTHCKCSRCGREVPYQDKDNFCPNCGAWMEES